MKLIKEYINEKFVQESDPIRDMGIGIKQSIENWLNKYGIENYKINSDNTIDVYGNVILHHLNITNFPPYIKFNIIKGIFSIQYNNFTTLRGCPKIVEDLFSCSNNRLSSLKYCPRKCGYFYCHSNKVKFNQTTVRKYCKVRSNDITT